ncbi:MAG: site-specific integrase [Eggerthellaceae bacterium]|nr:site-specific integrase [Eggerthellaceae bacterium]
MEYTSRGLRRRGDTDKWEVTLSHIDPYTGESIRTYHTVEARTEKQAQRKRDQLILDLEREGGAVGSTINVRDFLDHFLEVKEASKSIEKSTLVGYRYEARKISSYIGDVRLCDVNIMVVEEWMAKMVSEGYAPKTVAKPFRLLKQALKYAVGGDLIKKNPCDFCKPPKRKKTPINALDQADRSRMLRLARNAQPEPLGYMIEVALTTGMRLSEVCALRASAVLDEPALVVKASLGSGEHGYYEKEPKTESGIRTLPLTTRTWSGLQALKKDMLRTLGEFGVAGADPYLFGTWEADSKPYNPNRLGKEFTAFCKMNGFKCTFNDLRHTFATMMIGKGTDIRTVADWLGHASPSVTLDVYADVAPEAKRESLEKVKACFDVDMDFLFGEDEADPAAGSASGIPGLTFTVAQLELMLAEARAREKAQREADGAFAA